MLKDRLITGSIAGGLLVASLFIPGLPGALLFSALALALTLLAVDEYSRLVSACTVRLTPVMAAAACGLLVVNVCIVGLWPGAGAHRLLAWLPTEILILCTFLIVSFLDAARTSHLRDAVQTLTGTWAAIALIYGTLGFIPKLYFSAGAAMDGRLLLLFLLAVTKCGDIGAYAAGTATAKRPGGNHKLGTRLSPNKSWEGLLGGICASVLGAFVVVTLAGGTMSFRAIPVLTYTSAIVFGIAFAVLGLAGDLLESLLKRAAKADNSGRLPGLGGALDMIDSLIFTAPLFYGYVLFNVLSPL